MPLPHLSAEESRSVGCILCLLGALVRPSGKERAARGRLWQEIGRLVCAAQAAALVPAEEEG